MHTYYTYVLTIIIHIICFYLELNASIDALVQVNMTVIQLVTLTQRLQIELNDITTQTTILKTTCSATPGVLPTVCNMIPTTSHTVIVDYSTVSVYVIVCVILVCLYMCDIANHKKFVLNLTTKSACMHTIAHPFHPTIFVQGR